MPDPQSHPIKMENGNWSRSNQQKVDLFSEHLVKTFTPNDSSDVDLLINDNILENGELSPCTRSEVNKLIASLKPKKAAGFDLITSEVLVELPHKTLDNLTSLFNACIHWKYFPSFWKVAEVIMVAKPGKSPSIVSSYRPIAWYQ